MKYFTIILVVLLYATVSPSQRVEAAACDSGTSLSYVQTVDALANGSLTITWTPDLAAHRITASVANTTACDVPVSLSTYSMFGPYDPATLSKQIFFNRSATVTVSASSTSVLSADLPLCASQYDVWYGDAPHALVDNHVFGTFVAGGHADETNFCVPVIVATSTPPVSPGTTTVTVMSTSTPPVASTTPVADSPPVVTPPNQGANLSSVGTQFGVGGGGIDSTVEPTVLAAQSQVAAVQAVQTVFTPTSYPGLPNAGFGPSDDPRAHPLPLGALMLLLSTVLYSLYVYVRHRHQPSRELAE